MYDQFMKVYEIFKEKGLEDPLLDTLKLFDIASIGELRKTNLSSLEEKGVDLHQVADKRKEGVPLEYIIGYSPFMGLQLHCTPDALIPREETELLTRTAIG